MFDEKEITGLLNDYIDGRLGPEDERKLLSILEESEEQRDHLALISIVERLLTASKAPPVSTEKIMQALSQKERPPSRKRRKLLVRKEKPGKQIKPGRRKVWNKARSSYQQGSGVSFAITAAVLLLVAIGVWWSIRDNVPETSGPARQPVADRTAPDKAEPSPEPQQDYPKPTDAGRKQPTQQPEPVRTLPEEPPKQVITEDLKPPAGDGSDEPGFVPPPEDWTPLSSRDVSSGAQGEPTPPVLFIKIKTDKPRHWSVTPDDLSSLLEEIKTRLNVDYAMKVRSLDEIDPDPGGNPILYRTGHYHFILTHEERTKLRKFMLAGGMLVFNAGLGSKPFYDSARRELRLILPEIPIQRISSDHPLFHSYYNVNRVQYCPGVRKAGYKGSEPWFDGMTIDCRTAAIVSRWGMAIGWEGKEKDSYPTYRSEDAVKLGINLFSYATALRAWVKKTANAMKFIDREQSSVGKLFIVQVIYDGEWKTRHAGLSILLQTFNQKTAVPVKFGIKEMRLSDPGIFDTPLLYITGHEGFRLEKYEVAQLRKYLLSGGFVFAEACCGRKGFDRGFRAEMRRVMPGNRLKRIPQDNNVFSIPNKITYISVTPSLANQLGTAIPAPRLEGIEIDGHYGVIYSPYGMAGGWEGSQNPYAYGYNDAEALKLGQNILMYAITY